MYSDIQTFGVMTKMRQWYRSRLGEAASLSHGILGGPERILLWRTKLEGGARIGLCSWLLCHYQPTIACRHQNKKDGTH
jgi:hypothetical protein